MENNWSLYPFEHSIAIWRATLPGASVGRNLKGALRFIQAVVDFGRYEGVMMFSRVGYDEIMNGRQYVDFLLETNIQRRNEFNGHFKWFETSDIQRAKWFGVELSSDLFYYRNGLLERGRVFDIAKLVQHLSSERQRNISESTDSPPVVIEAGIRDAWRYFDPNSEIENLEYAFGLSIFLQTSIWFPSATNIHKARSWPLPYPDFDNRELGYLNAPRFNRFLHSVRDFGRSLGGTWSLDEYHSPHPQIKPEPLVDENGIILDEDYLNTSQ